MYKIDPAVTLKRPYLKIIIYKITTYEFDPAIYLKKNLSKKI